MINLTIEKIRPSVGFVGVAKFKDWARNKTMAQIVTFVDKRFNITFIDKRAEVRAEARDKIDLMAAEVDRRLSNVSGLAPTIGLMKFIEADEWIAAGQPSDVSAPKWHLIRAEIATLSEIHDVNATALQAVTSIKNMQSNWEAKVEKRETIRGVAKARIDKAESLTDINTILKKAEDLFSKI